MFCSNCGKKIADETVICPYCKYDLVNGGFYSKENAEEGTKSVGKEEVSSSSYSGGTDFYGTNTTNNNYVNTNRPASKKGIVFGIVSIVLMVVEIILAVIIGIAKSGVFGVFAIAVGIVSIVFAGNGLKRSIRGVRNARVNGESKGAYIAGIVISASALIGAIVMLFYSFILTIAVFTLGPTGAYDDIFELDDIFDEIEKGIESGAINNVIKIK